MSVTMLETRCPAAGQRSRGSAVHRWWVEVRAGISVHIRVLIQPAMTHAAFLPLVSSRTGPTYITAPAYDLSWLRQSVSPVVSATDSSLPKRETSW